MLNDDLLKLQLDGGVLYDSLNAQSGNLGGFMRVQDLS
jgi:hypothetical protein